MRLFTGLSIPPPISLEIERTLSELRPAAKLRWSPIENLHITTKFIGEWPASRLGELENALAAITSPGPFSVEVGHFGFLPNPHHPKIFFAGVHGEPGLKELAKRTDSALSSLGIKSEDRDYTPHITLARIQNENLVALRERIASSPIPEFGSFLAVEYHLYLSEAGPRGSTYSVIGKYSL